MFPLKNRLGWKPEPPDSRDLLLCSSRFSKQKPDILPIEISLKSKQTPVRDQGEMNSCTGFALSAMREYYEELDKEKGNEVTTERLSPLFIYNLEREKRGWLAIDEGAYIRDGLKVMQKFGVTTEQDFPYKKENLFVKPKPSQLSLKNCIYIYFRLQTIQEIKTCLAMGLVVVCGLTVYSNWELPIVYQTGNVPEPAGKNLGGHAVLIIGYSDKDSTFEYKNSWGTHWGNNGYFKTSQNYILHSGDDFWTIMKWK